MLEKLLSFDQKIQLNAGIFKDMFRNWKHFKIENYLG